MDHVVDRRPDELRRHGAARRPRPRTPRAHRRTRGRAGGPAHVRRAARGCGSVRGRAARDRRRTGRPGRGVPSDGRRVRRRRARARGARRDLHPDLLRLRRGGDRRPAARLRRVRAHLRRRLPSPGRGGGDEGDRRPGRRPRPERADGRRRGAAGPPLSAARA